MKDINSIESIEQLADQRVGSLIGSLYGVSEPDSDPNKSLRHIDQRRVVNGGKEMSARGFISPNDAIVHFVQGISAPDGFLLDEDGMIDPLSGAYREIETVVNVEGTSVRGHSASMPFQKVTTRYLPIGKIEAMVTVSTLFEDEPVSIKNGAGNKILRTKHGLEGNITGVGVEIFGTNYISKTISGEYIIPGGTISLVSSERVDSSIDLRPDSGIHFTDEDPEPRFIDDNISEDMRGLLSDVVRGMGGDDEIVEIPKEDVIRLLPEQ